MKSLFTYIGFIYVLMLLQTVFLPELFNCFGGFLTFVTVDFFLLLTLYFSFNRDFFNGFMWIVGLFLVESGLGYAWPGGQLLTLFTLFLLIQALKLQFVFQNFSSIQIVVFMLCFLEHVLHIYFGTGTSLGQIFGNDMGLIIFSALLHAVVAPYLFWYLTKYDERTIYRFEKQRTLFNSQIRSI